MIRASASAEETAIIEELRATIAGIVELQSQASKETRDWESRKEAMEELIEIHRREIALLTEELETSGRSAPAHAAAVADAEAGVERLREVRARMIEVVERAKPRVLSLVERLPRPLLNEIDAEKSALVAWKTGDEPREALQAMLGILSKASQFNRRISRSMEVVEAREVEVLYIGLARAFYADRSGAAGIGLPAANGWEWRADASINRRMLRAFDILDQKQAPSRIELPLHIE